MAVPLRTPQTTERSPPQGLWEIHTTSRCVSRRDDGGNPSDVVVVLRGDRLPSTDEQQVAKERDEYTNCNPFLQETALKPRGEKPA